jgi:hypothetical protein
VLLNDSAELLEVETLHYGDRGSTIDGQKYEDGEAWGRSQLIFPNNFPRVPTLFDRGIINSP